MGRALIRIFGVHTPKKIQDECEGIPTDQLPWADQVAPLVGGSSGAGAFAVPLCGTIVYCFFERGDPLHPCYFGVLMGKTAPQSNAQTNIPGTNAGMDPGVPGAPIVSNAKNICDLAKERGIDPCMAQALSQAESGGTSGVIDDGQGNNTPIVKYEAHRMYNGLVAAGRKAEAEQLYRSNPRLCAPYPQSQNKGIVSGGRDQSGTRALIEQAKAIDPKIAVEGTSYGKYQVMGEN